MSYVELLTYRQLKSLLESMNPEYLDAPVNVALVYKDENVCELSNVSKFLHSSDKYFGDFKLDFEDDITMSDLEEENLFLVVER